MSKSAKKSWREKLADAKGLPKVGRIEGKMSTRWGEGTMVIPAPLEVDALMRQVPQGRLVTSEELRLALAKNHGVTIACPLTTGIFAWIAAQAAAEAEQAGEAEITPYWRTLKAGGEINPKYPGGVEAVAERLRDEGHAISNKGRRVLVKDWAEKRFAFP